MTTRRRFLQRAGLGTLGFGLADRGFLAEAFARAFADEPGGALDFGPLEPLVEIMQSMQPDALLVKVVELLRGGERLDTLVTAAALANARSFGGADYDGYHAFMALAPALRISERSDGPERALPVLKVLHRNTTRILAVGGRGHEAMAQRLPDAAPSTGAAGDAASEMATAAHASDLANAEAAFAAACGKGKDAALAAFLPLVRESMDVHRVVLAWRSFETLHVTGDQFASVLMRQALRYCVAREVDSAKRDAGARELLSRLAQDQRLDALPTPTGKADLETLVKLADAIFEGDRAAAATAAATALASGMATEDVGEAISLAANHLLLEDPGVQREPSAAKPLGSVHGASIGVHASDSAHAWRNLARAVPAQAGRTLVAAAYHTGGQRSWSAESQFQYIDHLPELRDVKVDDLVARVESAIVALDQPAACAAAASYLARRGAVEELVAVLARHAIEDDGALHAEKYFVTATDEFASGRPEVRSRHLVALARVATSQHVMPGPGVVEARVLLASS